MTAPGSENKFRDFHRLDLQYLKSMTADGRLSEPVAGRYLDYIEMRLNDNTDLIYSDYLEYYIFFEAANSGVLTAFTYDLKTGRIMQQFGLFAAYVLELIKEYLPEPGGDSLQTKVVYNNEQYNYWRRHFLYKDSEYLLGLMYPVKTDITDRIRRLEQVFQRYYLPRSLHSDRRYMNLFTGVNEEVMQKIAPVLKEKKPVTFTYFRFEPFRKYVKLTGEHFATRIVEDLAEALKAKLKSEDTCYILNPREYLIVSLNCEKSIMQKRFHKQIFQVHSLILNYNTRFSTYKTPVESLSEIWKEIADVNTYTV